jgi:hypothetical protein
MTFRRFRSIGSPPRLLAGLPRAMDRNSILAKREQLAARERSLAQEIERLRAQQDDLSNALHQPAPESGRVDVRSMINEELRSRPLDTAAGARLISEAGDRARAGAPVKLPPRGSVARLIVLAGRKARGEKVDDEY